ncbi:MAG: hypothetical protein ACLQVF_39165 [Isosphaeraceae bacterium]
MPVLEQLEGRIVLTSTLASTTVAGASVGQALSNVVNNTALGGLTVRSTAGFNSQNPPNYLLLSQSGTNFALVSYVGNTSSSFTTLALPAGDGNHVLSSSTIVEQHHRRAGARWSHRRGAGTASEPEPIHARDGGSAEHLHIERISLCARFSWQLHHSVHQ